jgi:hypothetical protein
MTDNPPLENEAPSPAAPEQPRAQLKRRWLRRVTVAVVVLLVLGLGFVAVLPTLLSTGPGTRFVAGQVEDRIDGRVSIGDLDVGWFSPLSLASVTVDAADESRLIELARLETEVSLWDLVTAGDVIDLGETTIDINFPNIELYPNGESNLERTFGLTGSDDATPDDEKAEAEAKLPFRGKLNLEKFEVTVQQVDEAGQPLRRAGEAVPYAGLLIEDASLDLTDDGIANDLPIQVKAQNRPAGRMLVQGEATLDGSRLMQTVALDDLDLAALTLVARAFSQDVPVVLAGIGNGTVVIESTTGRANGELTFSDFSADPVDGTGFATSELTLAMDATATDEVVTLNEMRLATSDGFATLAATVDRNLLEAAGPEAVQAVRDLAVEVDLPYLQVDGGGPSVVGLNLPFSADLDALQAAFGDFVTLEDAAYAGRIENGRLRTQQRGQGIAARVEGDLADVYYETIDSDEPTEIEEASFVAFGTFEPGESGGQVRDLSVSFDQPETIDATVTADRVTMDLEIDGLAILAETDGIRIEGPLELEIGDSAVSVTSSELTLNDGPLNLAGASYATETGILQLPAGPLVEDAKLNPVLTDLLGQFVNPLLTDPQSAEGLLNIDVASPALIDTESPLAGQLAILFTIESLKVENDVVGALAEQTVEQARSLVDARAGSLTRVPGLDIDAFINDKLRLDDRVREEISSLSGEVKTSTLRLDGGVATTTFVLSLDDPRRGGDDGVRYDLTFAGTIDVETLAMSLSATVPTNLIEKWAGENPGDLVDLFGERPFRTLLDEGVTLGFAGTTPAPRVEAANELDAVVARAVDAALKNAGSGLLKRGLRDLFD